MEVSTKKLPLTEMVIIFLYLSMLDTVARPPIGLNGNFPVHMAASHLTPQNPWALFQTQKTTF